RLGWVMFFLVLAQGAIGYSQYFSGLPAGLVWVHVSDSVLIWIVALLLMFATRDRGPVTEAAAGGAREGGAAPGGGRRGRPRPGRPPPPGSSRTRGVAR